MSIHGCFLCFGASAAPRLMVLSESRMQFLADKMKIAETRCRDQDAARAKVYGEFFEDGVQWAIPAWSKEAMLALVQSYEGTHEKAVRTMAAMVHEGFYEKVWNGVVLAKPNPPDAKPKGGQPAIIDSPKPKKPTGGNAVKAKSKAKTPAMAGAR